MTPLQIALARLVDALLSAREDLTPEEYSWLVGIGCDVLGAEAARLFAGEVIRAMREEEAA